MKYAVISSGSRQYLINEGDTIEVNLLKLKPEETYKFSEVLLFVEDGKVKIGKPNLESVIVEGVVLNNHQGPKIRVAKFKAKSRYRKVIGFRQSLSKVKIQKIALINKA